MKQPVLTYAQYVILDRVSDDPETHISQDSKKTALRLVAKRYLSRVRGKDYTFRITKTGQKVLNSNPKIIR